ncbi:hypothetical protein MD588_08650 [Photobacterium sp. SDRW27]|uniref:hypothetical protein n=1 Tax=Photobacterium obscurum TaxID=2829490 RepID=UPI0022438E3F|nr:hypothetical protein [Photobacterium obscurum]MCW8328877.1 hypothetical protein [Photobacterium obscurum]
MILSKEKAAKLLAYGVQAKRVVIVVNGLTFIKWSPVVQGVTLMDASFNTNNEAIDAGVAMLKRISSEYQH